MTEADYDTWLRKVDQLPEPHRTAVTKWARQQMARVKSVKNFPNPAALAASLDEKYVITPAIQLISEALQETLTTRRARLLITMPPQEGKSELVGVWTVIRALQQNPDARIILASFSQELAEQASRRARNIVQAHGTGAVDPLTQTPATDMLGLALANDKAQAAHWRLQGHQGGMVAVGFGGTITGRPADLLIIDDPLKGMVAADSAAERRKVIEGFQGDLTTRLAPGAPIILIQTRWHENDLAGWILSAEEDLPPEERRWRHINIPAQAEVGLQDALDREPGQWLLSSRGRTAHDWEETKRSVGTRVWAALYQGVPTPLGGGLFSREEIDKFRSEETELVGRVVSVDPAESGTGDEAGILVLGWDASATAYVEQDYSAKMTSAQWSRCAVIAALRHRCGDIVLEAFTGKQTYMRVVEEAWRDIHRQATLLRLHHDIAAAAEAWSAEGRGGDALTNMKEVNKLLHFIPQHQEIPFRIVPWTAAGDKVARAAGARQGVSTGRLRIMGRLPGLEKQMTTWQVGQSSPDRVDALVNGFEHIVKTVGSSGFDIAAPWGMA